MMKWLLLALVVVGVLWWLGRGRSGPRRSDAKERSATPGGGPGEGRPGSSSPPAPQPMVACAHCGLLLPRADAVTGGEPALPYCSDAHRRAGPKAS